MQLFKAILYGGDSPLAGAPVDVVLSGDCLSINAQAIHVNCDKIIMSVGGFDHNEFYLHWYAPTGEAYSLKLMGKNDIAFIMANAPVSLKQQFNKWHQRRLSIRLVWTSLASIAGVFVLSLGLLWWQYDAAVTWLTQRVSVKQEEQLGQSVLTQIEGDGDMVKQGLAIDTLKNIGKQLTQNSRYHYQWFIKKDKTVNAFALPGGIIIVNSALIAKADNADELAAVLAHEVQHVEQQHALKNMVNSLGWAAALMVVLGDVNAATAVIAHQLGNMYFSRDSEDEADRLGLQALIRAKIAPDGMVTLLQKLAKEPGANPPEWLSSHPDIAERIKTIQNLLKEQPCKACQPLVFDWMKIQQDKALLKVPS
ncbi:MAG: M48 family metalloprotease [Methylovulum sp.]|uniref:M48 family metallopeptidase n=1 Tax=Methylovulum sp. TaxID=1916980 RepID=UPI002616879D|nr:M48 family metalloprotease [Methylovulum sp.]MDD2725386.1 M48 family metalloprotease [Methylovulum sp.]MDD5125551.1 M48 family metalloprotease [Methylovulum sp.]